MASTKWRTAAKPLPHQHHHTRYHRPEIILTSIEDGFVTTQSQITIAGSVQDIRSRLVQSREATLSINGIAVPIINRAFEQPNFLLQPGLNAITVVAMDALGKKPSPSTASPRLVNDLKRLPTITNAPSAGVTLDQPLVARLIDRNGVSIVDRAVTF